MTILLKNGLGNPVKHWAPLADWLDAPARRTQRVALWEKMDLHLGTTDGAPRWLRLWCAT